MKAIIELSTTNAVPGESPIPCVTLRVQDRYAVTIDSGLLVITYLGPIRKALRRCWRWLWSTTGRIRPAELPL